jgi:aminopeptidase N
MQNPNRVRALIGTFANGNPVAFHDPSGAGYRLLADAILRLDPVNSQVAARLTIALGASNRQDARRQGLMRAELARVLAAPGLSDGTREVAERSSVIG